MPKPNLDAAVERGAEMLTRELHSGREWVLHRMGQTPEIITEAVLTAALRLDDPETVERVAKRFHDAYEQLAPAFGYKTRPESAVPWEDVPEVNRQLMIVTTKASISALLGDDEG